MVSPNIVGRRKEVEALTKAYESNRSEFVAVYGRRRVGKTFLIKELFADRYTFFLTGLAKGKLQRQLINFHSSLQKFFPLLEGSDTPGSWYVAFKVLMENLEKSNHKKKVVFIDELPWLDTKKSDFMTELEYFWNGWAYHRKDILLIVCGSATSWMITELINDKGGLHNRVTSRIHLQPFTLRETENFLKTKGGVFDRYQIVELYMAMGGIPFYLEQVDPGKSVFQNLDSLFFSKGGILRAEFQNLFRSLFKKYERHVMLVEALAQKAKGMSRNELAAIANISNGGTFTEILKELELCGFIEKQLPFGKATRGSQYHLTDPFSLFYLKFVKNSKAFGEGAWMNQKDLPSWRAWSGYAFEITCFYHIDQIKKELGIAAVYTEISSWKNKGSENTAQIDLVIDRRDRVIQLCEIKFSENKYAITKAYAENLRRKVTVFKEETGTKKTIFLTFITTFGLQNNTYAKVLVQNSLELKDLFSF